ncbi:ABC transporter permease subunit [Labilibaculum sp. A4]|uniref:ABC transporter permease subunit n=1 Tax=Labilibaculum euxinus TaxID=2686357 RepID=UPI000F62460B|nr:ABC transporter permease subunit [Labilibaculum euxinus]MDQ1769869.1 ABC transporter permease subunit [Labilibaculum euxinus]MWN76425.1 ABC transporter permease subunit [Labilibaculum euxinus]
MKQILHIASRELSTFFDSLTAYVLIVIFLGFSGFFTWIYGADVFFVGQANLNTFFTVAYWSLFIFIPALTMRSIAGELKAGTLELLLTKPVSDWQLIFGKFLSTLLLIAIALAPTVIYYFTLWAIGPVDHSAILLGYVGLLLMSMVYISIGLLASCIASNPIIASLAALSIGIFFHIIFDVLASNFVGLIGSFFSYLSLSTHFESISRGVVDTKDLIYFFSLVFFCLFTSKMILSNRNL